MKPHKWAKEIKAWADGAEIEWRFNSVALDRIGEWESCLSDTPMWHDPRCEYRIKPQPKEPQYLYVYARNGEVVSMYEAPRGWSEDYIGKIKLEQDDERY